MERGRLATQHTDPRINRSERASILRLGWRSNLALTWTLIGTVAVQLAIVYVPWLQPIFGTAPLGIPELAVVLAASSVALVAVEAEKWLRRRRDATEMRPNRNLSVG